MLVQKYFADEYSSADIKGECYTDAKNGGDIATELKFIEDGTPKDHWKSYELTYALQNPDKGCPESMYKALVVAKEKGIITTEESRWDEGVTKSDFLEMLTNSYLALPAQVSADLGKGAPQPTIDEKGNTIYPDYPEDYVKFESMEEKTMYVIKMGTLFFNPNMFEGQLNKWGEAYPKGELESDGEMIVNGKCEIDGVEYYRSEVQNNTTENLTVIIEASCLSDTPPAEESNSTDVSSNTSTDTSFDYSGYTQEEIDMLNNDPNLDPAYNFDNIPYFEPNTEWTEEQLDAADGMITY